VTSDLSKNLLRRHASGDLDLVIALHDEASPAGGRRLFTEPLVWITSNDHGRHTHSPLPVVVAPPPCIYRDRILQTLNALNKPCRIAYLSSSYNGILAAVRTGLGVTVMARSTAPVSVRVLSGRDDFPPLGDLELRLHRYSGKQSEAMRCLEDYIAGSFAEADPLRAPEA
jgi:DNA-binding transcriptional LysR family regulator